MVARVVRHVSRGRQAVDILWAGVCGGYSQEGASQIASSVLGVMRCAPLGCSHTTFGLRE